MEAKYDLRTLIKRKYDLRSAIRGRHKTRVGHNLRNKRMKRRVKATIKVRKTKEYTNVLNSEQNEPQVDDTCNSQDQLNDIGNNRNDSEETGREVEVIAIEESSNGEDKEHGMSENNPIGRKNAQRADNKRRIISYSDLDYAECEPKRSRYSNVGDEKLYRITSRDCANFNASGEINKTFTPNNGSEKDLFAENSIVNNRCVKTNPGRSNDGVRKNTALNKVINTDNHRSGESFKGQRSDFSFKDSITKHNRNVRNLDRNFLRQNTHHKDERYRGKKLNDRHRGDVPRERGRDKRSSERNQGDMSRERGRDKRSSKRNQGDMPRERGRDKRSSERNQGDMPRESGRDKKSSERNQGDMSRESGRDKKSSERNQGDMSRESGRDKKSSERNQGDMSRESGRDKRSSERNQGDMPRERGRDKMYSERNQGDMPREKGRDKRSSERNQDDIPWERDRDKMYSERNQGDMPGGRGRDKRSSERNQGDMPWESVRDKMYSERNQGDLPRERGRDQSSSERNQGDMPRAWYRDKISSERNQGDMPWESVRDKVYSERNQGDRPSDRGRDKMYSERNQGDIPRERGRGKSSSERNQGDMPRERSRDKMYSERNQGDIPRERGRDKISSERNQGDMPRERSRDKVYSERNQGDMPRERGRDKMYSERNQGDMPRERSRDKMYSERNQGDMPRERSRDNMYSERNQGDMPRERGRDKMYSERNQGDMPRERGRDKRSSERNQDDIPWESDRDKMYSERNQGDMPRDRGRDKMYSERNQGDMPRERGRDKRSSERNQDDIPWESDRDKMYSERNQGDMPRDRGRDKMYSERNQGDIPRERGRDNSSSERNQADIPRAWYRDKMYSERNRDDMPRERRYGSSRRRSDDDERSHTKTTHRSKDKRYLLQNRNDNKIGKISGNGTQRVHNNGNKNQQGDKFTRSNRQVLSNQRLFIEKEFPTLLTKHQDEVAVIMGARTDDLEHYLWKKDKHTSIKDFVQLMEMVCRSDRNENKKKILYILKETRFFERYDVTTLVTSVSMEGKINNDGNSYLQSLLTISYSLVDTIKAEYEEMFHFVTIVDGITKYLDEENKKIVLDKIKQIIEAIKENKQDTSNLRKNEESNITDKEILPSIEDIKNNKGLELKQRPIEDPFTNAQEYLSHTFHLFCEDFVRPLRKGIKEYIGHIENHEKQNTRFRHDDIRIFENVHIIKCDCSAEDGLIWNMQFDVSRYKRVNWNARSLLQYGTLVCLSCDRFSTIVYATVARRNPDELKEGKLHISFLDIPLDSIIHLTNETFVMIECKASYASYSSPLSVIRDMYTSVEKGEELPFSSYLVQMDQSINTPKYFQKNEQQVSLDCILDWQEPNLQINILNEFERPNAEMLGLDESQLKALYLGLTKELALIQGPPGTGKTVIGLKITNVLLNNASMWGGEQNRTENAPLLVLSYTNHALDQFLEEILKMPVMLNCDERDVVRVGSRTDSMKLAKHNISKRRREILTTMDIAISNDKLRERQLHHERLQTYRENLKSGLLHEKYLFNVNIIPKEQYDFLMSCEPRYSVLIDWLEIPSLGKYKLKSTHDYEAVVPTSIPHDNEMEYSDMSDEEDADIMDDYESESESEFKEDFSELRHLFRTESKSKSNIESLKPKFAVSTSILFPEHPSQLFGYFSRIDENTRANIAWNIRRKIHDQDRMSESEAISIRDVWCLLLADRWRLYRYWLYMLETEMDKKKSENERSYERAQRRYKEARVMADVSALRRAKVVGMTTTRAAKDMEVIRKVGPRIIILEEAAEIPEHHALACISSSCQHLIMIGDHQQLRPAYNDYKLSKEFNTNISLFERLIRANLPFCQLSHQHRMRPEISKLLTPHIYRCLTDHESVLRLKNVRGVATNLFFLSHTELENRNQECESKSHVNKHEAHFVCSLYRYLRIQGYTDDDITILTTYKDQMRTIKKIIAGMEKIEFKRAPEYFENNIDVPMVGEPKAFFEDRRDFTRNNVRVTVVDNFQGEENKIIIMSLVRSNDEGRIGYLREANRICVALSRAKNGLFVIGNMSLLEQKSPLWRKILSDAKKRGSVGNSLILSCQKHPLNKTAITKINDFELVRDGGCNQQCGIQKKCGHVCDRLCHPDDEAHERRCLKECKKPLCDLGHRCSKPCFKDCGLCKEQVTKILPNCGHEQQMFCSTNLEYVKCKLRCEKQISCGHQCQRYCGEQCNTPDDCFKLVKIKAICGHEFQAPCCTQDNPQCTVPCDTELECGHICKGKCSTCSQGRLHIPCNMSSDKTLVCGHSCREKCSIPCPPCKEDCDVKCSHRKCAKKCGSPCIACREDCDWKCEKNCQNGFKCDKLCYELCNRQRCDAPCTKKLQCGHVCPGLLCEKCPNKCLTCNREELTEILFGDEDEPNARFIQMEDCECVFELRGLDQFMDAVEDDTSEISGIKRCPKCRTVIETSKRYGNRLKLQRKDIEAVHRVIEHKNSSDLEKERKHLVEKRSNLQTFFYDLENLMHVRQRELNHLEHIFRIQTQSGLILAENQLNFLTYLNTVVKQLDRLEENCNDDVMNKMRFLWNRIVSVSRWVFEPRRQFCNQELEEFRLEMTRISVFVDFVTLLRDIQIGESSEELDKINTVVIDVIKKLENVTKLPMSELEKLQDEFNSLRKKVPENGMGISKEEQIMVIKAMNLPISGHWYKCKNGHFYAIGDCGHAMVQTKCPHCDVIIGGSGHILNADNARATEMEIPLDE